MDFVVIAATELLISGQTDCSIASQQVLRQSIVVTGKSIQAFLVTPNGACRAFEESPIDLPSEVDRAQWSQATNPNFRFGIVGSDQSQYLGISWGFGTELELVSFINPEAVVFDTLPAELRDRGRIDLAIDGEFVGAFLGDAAADIEGGDWGVFVTDDARYPISVALRVDRDDLDQWHANIPPGLIIIWSGVGFLFSCGLAYAVVSRHDQVLADVVRALTHQQMTAHFQPLFETGSLKVVGCEALARWTKPDGEIVSPGRFIPLIEEHGLADDLLSIMMEHAAKALRPIIEAEDDFYVSFNVTPDQLSQEGFAAAMIALSRKHLMPPQQVCIEITERQIMSSVETAAEETAALSAAGFRIAIDDAGTGHNGLASMQRLSANTIKIDKFFVDHIEDDPRSRVMVDMFVSVAARYGMQTVAEGVETSAQLATLRSADVSHVQGFLLSKPLPADEFVERFKSGWIHGEKPEASAGRVDLPDLSRRYQVNGPFESEPGDNVQDADDAEVQRLAALYRYQILDTEEEEAFDRITRIIRNALDSTMAAIALIDAERRWFKSVAGGKRGELPREESFCNLTIKSPMPTVVPDAHQDPRFQDNILVTGPPYVRAYIGVPLQMSDGHRIGSVCCVDTHPREFSEKEVQLVKDLTSIVIEQIEMRSIALFDEMTGARSRQSFNTEAKIQLATSRIHRRPFSVMMLDIDHFKQVNDGYGHKVGDEVLAELGDRVSQLLPERYLFGRLGGEEFAIAMPGTEISSASALAERLRKIIEINPFATSRGAVPVTLSIGIARQVSPDDSLDQILEQADWALYQAKGRGRNRIVTFDQDVA
ncbi:MAG: EAL domain-containing protein [Pseudomonadota bacterium]